jgi:acetylornithine deacetylase/succinyl-diaminopimelate desuccinylase-like protein
MHKQTKHKRNKRERERERNEQESGGTISRAALHSSVTPPKVHRNPASREQQMQRVIAEACEEASNAMRQGGQEHKDKEGLQCSSVSSLPERRRGGRT